MKLIAAAPKDFSAAERKRAIRSVDKNPGQIDKLMKLFLTEHYWTSQRLAGVLEAVGRKNPALLQAYLKQLVARLEASGDADTALKRNIPRILQWMPIPVRLQGRVVNVCFRLLSDPAELVAAKVFSMTVLANIAKAQPDLKSEIRYQIESQYNLSTPAFRSRAKRVIKMLDR